jgi:hypothetical protein
MAQQLQAQVAVAPTRTVLRDGARNTEFAILNRGDGTETFEVGFQHFDMDEGGRLHETHPADAEALESLFLVTPSKAQLRPGESQVFRIQATIPRNLAPGEYRVHLTFRPMQLLGEGPASSDAAQVQVEAQARLGVSVPVLLRHGTRGARAWIEDLRQGTGKLPGLSLRLFREGDESIFGDLALYRVEGSGGLSLLTSRKGIAVYPSQTFRILELPFSDGSLPPGTRVRAVFTAPEQGLKAEADLVL